MWACCKEGSHCERQTFKLDVDKEYHYGDIFSGQVDLAYDISQACNFVINLDELQSILKTEIFTA